MDFTFLKAYSPEITNEKARINLANNYSVIISASLTHGLYRLDFRDVNDRPVCAFEEEEIGLKAFYGYLYQEEVLELIEEISFLDECVPKSTIFPISQTNTPLEELVNVGEAPIQRLMIEDASQDDVARYEANVQQLYSFNQRKHFYLGEEAWAGTCRNHGEYTDPSDPRYIRVAFGGSEVANMYAGSELSKSLHLYDGQTIGAYKTSKEYWLSKVDPSKIKMDETGKDDIFFMGHALESAVADCFERTYKKEHPDDTIRVFNDPHMYQCGRTNDKGELDLPFVLCNLDRFVVINGVKGILECKTCQFSSKDRPLWENGQVPLHYYMQLQWYMLCMNLPFCYIACLMGNSLSNLVYIYVERNFAVENLVIKMAKDFEYKVLNKIEPDFNDEEPLENMLSYYRKTMGPYNPAAPFVKLGEDSAEACKKILSINNEVELLTEQIEELKKKRLQVLVDDIFPYFGDANEGTVKIDDKSFYRVTLRNKSRTTDIDTERLKADHPDIYERYLKMPAVKYAKELAKNNPVEYEAYVKAHKPKFNASQFAKEHPELLAEYYVPDKDLTDTKMNFCNITYMQIEDIAN